MFSAIDLWQEKKMRIDIGELSSDDVKVTKCGYDHQSGPILKLHFGPIRFEMSLGTLRCIYIIIGAFLDEEYPQTLTKPP